jgi:hypothetical protein
LQLVAAAGETHHRHEPRVAVAMGWKGDAKQRHR